MSFKPRLFLILFLPGLAGVLSFLLVDLSAIVALVPVQDGSEVPTVTPALKLLSLIQPTVLVAAATLIGVLLASRVGLSSPLAEALAAGERPAPALRPQLLPGALGALAGGLSILVTTAVLKPFLTRETIERIAQFGRLVPLPTRLLYGGITEELLMRWGLMTLIVWAAWRLFQKRQMKPAKASFILAILISAFVFGVGHLPVAVFLLRETSVAIVLFVIIANSTFGLVVGYLYWQYGLESAMIAHLLGHVVLAVASYSGAYF